VQSAIIQSCWFKSYCTAYCLNPITPRANWHHPELWWLECILYHVLHKLNQWHTTRANYHCPELWLFKNILSCVLRKVIPWHITRANVQSYGGSNTYCNVHCLNQPPYTQPGRITIAQSSGGSNTYCNIYYPNWTLNTQPGQTTIIWSYSVQHAAC